MSSLCNSSVTTLFRHAMSQQCCEFGTDTVSLEQSDSLRDRTLFYLCRLRTSSCGRWPSWAARCQCDKVDNQTKTVKICQNCNCREKIYKCYSIVCGCQSVVVISEKLCSALGQWLHKKPFSRKRCSSHRELTWPQLRSCHHPASSSGCYLQTLRWNQLTSASALCNWYYISTAGWICPKYTVNRRSCRETVPNTTELAVIQYRTAGKIDSALQLLN